MNLLLEKENVLNNFHVITLILFGFFLNQTGNILGVNLSFSDLFFVIILIILMLNNEFKLKSTFILFFLFISIIGLFSSIFWAPFIFNISSNIVAVLLNYFKFIIVFFYMVLGYNIARLKYDSIIFKSFCLGGLAVGLIGIFLSITKMDILNELLYYSSVRYRGIMNDPNFFAIIQVAVLACVIKYWEKNVMLKTFFSIVIILSILISGSKTGFITLGIFVVYKVIGNIMLGKKSIPSLIALCFIPFLFLLNISSFFTLFLEKLSGSIPILFRVVNLLSNPMEALSSGGSGRTGIWVASLEIIENSPFLGVGFGTFVEIVESLTGSGAVAHNTYIQIIAEWGIFVGGLSLFYLLILFVYLFFSNNKIKESNLANDIIFVLLVGSLGISLNNSRLLWFVIGILIYYAMNYKTTKSGGSESY